MNMCSYECCAVGSDESLLPLAATLKLIGEPNRLRILCVVRAETERCVCEMMDVLPDISQSLLSHHLADLRAGGLVANVKRGSKVYYRLTDYGQSVTATVLALRRTEAAV